MLVLLTIVISLVSRKLFLSQKILRNFAQNLEKTALPAEVYLRGGDRDEHAVSRLCHGLKRLANSSKMRCGGMFCSASMTRQ